MTDDLLQHFIVEARELVQQASDDLLALEGDPTVRGHLDSAFRAVHTLKGSVGLFDFAPMGFALHAAEDLLGALKDGRRSIDSEVIDTLLECVGQADLWVRAVAGTGQLPPDAAEEGYRLARILRAHFNGGSESEAPALSETDSAWIDELMALRLDGEEPKGQDNRLVAIKYTPRADCFFAGDDPIALLSSVPNLVAVRISNREPWPSAAEMDPFSCNLRIEALSNAALDAVKAIFRFVPDQVALHEIALPGAEPAHVASSGLGPVSTTGTVRTASSQMLRVDPTRIDRLAHLVGEMVVAKNGLAHLAGNAGDAMDRKGLTRALVASQASIDRLVAEMHRAVMDVRMMPMRDIFRRFPRAVRDIAGQLGKTVDFSVKGEDVEADKSVVASLFDPLLHVLRNAVSHGAELKHFRADAGKPTRTRVEIRARRDGDRLVVEVEDDGRGIDPAAIRRLACERGLVSREKAESMTDAEAIELIFAPGFSTATEVTDLSGRGVGMDAVRSAVERLGGQASVESSLGFGTTIRLSLPLTVVMTRVLAVRVGAELYGIPIDGILETALVPAARILPIQDSEAFVLRDRTLVLVRLADLLDVPRPADPAGGMKVLVMKLGDDLVGIAVDEFAERMDVLMRPMNGILAGMPGAMGTTLLGDGSVLMILDIPELIG